MDLVDELTITKHHGLGNDFLIALVEALPADGPQLAKRLCNRRTSIGADGLIFGVRAGDSTDFVLFNADGSRPEVSGNGLRCLGQALAMDSGAFDQALGEPISGYTATIGTDAGPRLLTVWPSEDPLEVSARVDMGPAAPGPAFTDVPIDQLVPAKRIASVDMGNPHIVVEVDDPRSFDMATVGPAIESHFMPTGANVHLVAGGSSPAQLTMNIWERGAGVTEACGSGACAAASAAVEWGLCESTVDVDMPGGSAIVEVTDTIHLIGPATYVARIEVPHG